MDQDTAIEIAPSVFIQRHTCSYCDQLELDFDSPKSPRWLHEKSSIHFGLSVVECKVAAEDGCALLAWIFDNLELRAGMFPKADWPLLAYVGDNRDKVQFGFASMVAAMCCEREYQMESCRSSKAFTIFAAVIQLCLSHRMLRQVILSHTPSICIPCLMTYLRREVKASSAIS